MNWLVKKIIAKTENKKILILGFGKEGQSAYLLLRKYLPEQKFAIADASEKVKESPLLTNDSNLTLHLGENYLSVLPDFDLIIKTPGIALEGKIDDEVKSKLTSQLDLLLEFNAVNVIGITGSKGKSTTTALLYKMVHKANPDSVLTGNIGIPIFDVIDTLNTTTTVVCEMSSYQLEYSRVSPHIAILLNLYEEHLDHHGTFENYVNSKLNIFLHQGNNDLLVYNRDHSLLHEFVAKSTHNGEKSFFSNDRESINGCYEKNGILYYGAEAVYDTASPRHLLGKHNLYNIMAAICVAKHLGLKNEIITQVISEFEPLPHRMQYFGTYNEIAYYDDSISTIPQAAIQAIEALKNVDTIILGGLDRGIDFTPIAEYLPTSTVKNIAFLPTSGAIIWELMKKKNPLIVERFTTLFAETLHDAVTFAKEKTAKGKICLLSPASPSYNMFKNFEERGDLFQQEVKKSYES